MHRQRLFLLLLEGILGREGLVRAPAGSTAPAPSPQVWLHSHHPGRASRSAAPVSWPSTWPPPQGYLRGQRPQLVHRPPPKQPSSFWGHRIRPSAQAPRLMSTPGAEGKERHGRGPGAGHAPSGSSKRVSRRMRWKVGSLVPEISLSVMMTWESSVSHSPGPSCQVETG